MSFFKRTKVEDERITNLKNKIYAEIYILILVLCGISLIIKYFIINMGIESVATELIVLLVGGVYYAYRSIKLGVYSAEVEMHDQKSKWTQKKKNLYIGITLGICIALFMGINSAVQYAEGVGQSIYYFLLTATASLMIYLPLFIILLVVVHDVMKKKSDKAIDKMLGDDNEKY